ncbi:MAG: MFS transporter [Furfurilactobacillus sp.]|uniref:MFS transporter n=1 Tax=Furfurilactobacillus milii TaxID=2888272 RepID=A0ABT6D782_9LACO|nr:MULTISPECIES: MFS transporter [Furfurilactobacillus]QLE66575.1 General substrate transporter [Furfurilactobacillus rossiae]MCF6160027.1 MFS transporter [Furfurilactobacillus milii]MCF6162424.1 MFS transporter [Furfurilactobacillus milii]MCF6419944.1 MFS transporter [Furfurilactobacillus milii]MCH4010719.1 MFS transporter [Furfurilactobacillus sp.]
MVRSPKSWLFKVAILSISLVLVAANAVAGVIPLMEASLPHVSHAAVEGLITAPSITVLIFVIFSSAISDHIGMKNTVLLGLLITGVAGIMPMFTSSYWVILAARLGFGAGLGLFNSIAYSIFSIYYEGDERATLLGFQGAVTAVGSILFFLVVAQLTPMGWHATFIVYGISFLILALFALVVPSDRHQQGDEDQPKQSINRAVIGYSLLWFLIMMLFTLVTLKASTLIIAGGYGTAAQGSLILAIVGGGQMLGGLVYGSVYKWIATSVLPGSALLTGILIVGLALSRTLWLTFVIAALLGITSAFVGPYLFGRVADVAPANSATLASSMMLIGINIASFIAPYFWGLVANLFHNTTPSFNLTISGIAFLIIGIIVVVGRLIHHPKKAQSDVQ